ncbi:MAG: BatD family protein [Kiritimatiellia bacterium]
MSNMFYRWQVVVGILCAGVASAQTLRVQMAPESIMLGDPFQIEVMAEGVTLANVDFAFSQTVQKVQQQSKSMTVNGRMSSSLIYTLLPSEVGTCRLMSLSAQTSEGKTLSFSEHRQVKVQAVTLDRAVELTSKATPEEVLQGDEVLLTLSLRVPALQTQGRVLVPFYGQDFFGRLQERTPNVSFEFATSPDACLKPLLDRVSSTREMEGTNVVWRFAMKYRATKEGEIVFPAPIMRDERAVSADAEGRLQTVRSVAVGQPLKVQVQAPPSEGRPHNFIGVIAHTLAVKASLDTLQAKMGDPLRLTVTFTTDGEATSIRAPKLPKMSGFRTYGEPTRETFEGGCSLSYSVRPMRAGLLELPPLSFGWFERSSRTYQEARTVAVPVRVLPSAQLVLLGDDGEQALTELPSALVMNGGRTPLRGSPSRWALGVLILGGLLLMVRLLLRPVAALGRKMMAPIVRRRPRVRAQAILARTKDPAEAAAAIRAWLGRPSLTPSELRALLPAVPEAELFAKAYAQVENAAYSSGEDVPEARATLRRLLPQMEAR